VCPKKVSALKSCLYESRALQLRTLKVNALQQRPCEVSALQQRIGKRSAPEIRPQEVAA
jgi:hypothetical protein